MRVDKLIEELSKMPQHEDVRIYEDGTGQDESILAVDLRAQGNAAYVVLQTWGGPVDG